MLRSVFWHLHRAVASAILTCTAVQADARQWGSRSLLIRVIGRWDIGRFDSEFGLPAAQVSTPTRQVKPFPADISYADTGRVCDKCERMSPQVFRPDFPIVPAQGSSWS